MAISDDEKHFNEIIEKQDRKLDAIKSDLEKKKRTLEKMGLTPYSYSELDRYLSLESWFWKDALLLLAGANPTGASVDWSGYIYCDVNIDLPTVKNVSFLDCRLPDYDVPVDYSYGDNKNYFKGDEEIERKISEITKLNKKLNEIYTHWVNALDPHKERNSPSYFIEWAISKKITIAWLDWAVGEGLYAPKQNVITDKPLANKERETLLVIIAALAKEAGLDISKISKTGDLIANMTQLLGAPIGATTIETHLKKINQALQSRAK